jgi:hypothetical protein
VLLEEKIERKVAKDPTMDIAMFISGENTGLSVLPV